MEVTLTKAPSAQELKHPGYHAPITTKEEFLTKESWEKGEKERAERADRRRGGEREEGRGRRDNREERGGENRRGRGRRDRND